MTKEIQCSKCKVMISTNEVYNKEIEEKLGWSADSFGAWTCLKCRLTRRKANIMERLTEVQCLLEELKVDVEHSSQDE